MREHGIDAIDLLVRHGDEAKILAGGHSLIPLMKLRLLPESRAYSLFRTRSSASPPAIASCLSRG